MGMIGLDRKIHRIDARGTRSESLIRFKHNCRINFCKNRFSVFYGERFRFRLRSSLTLAKLNRAVPQDVSCSEYSVIT